MRIYLVRHAESMGNISGVLSSTTDFALTEKGKCQARRAGEVLRRELSGGNVAAYCSPQMRAKQTLSEILNCLEQSSVAVTESIDLREMDLGILEGMPFEEQERNYPQVDLARGLSVLQAPGGESYPEIRRRVLRFLEQYGPSFDNQENVIICSHGITLRVLTNLLLQRPDEDVNILNWMENTAITILESEKGAPFVPRCINNYAHLQDLRTANYEQWGLFAEPEAYLQGSCRG